MEILAASVAVFVALSGQQGNEKRKEPFAIFSSLIPVEDARWHPDPIWVNIKWEPTVEAPFRAISDSLTAANLAPLNSDKSGVWARKSREAYKDWYSDHQNAVKLYKVATIWESPVMQIPPFVALKNLRA